MDETNECCVCYEPNNYLVTPCNHNLCIKCSYQMQVKIQDNNNKRLCPYCKTKRTDICEQCSMVKIICCCKLNEEWSMINNKISELKNLESTKQMRHHINNEFKNKMSNLKVQKYSKVTELKKYTNQLDTDSLSMTELIKQELSIIETSVKELKLNKKQNRNEILSPVQIELLELIDKRRKIASIIKSRLNTRVVLQLY